MPLVPFFLAPGDCHRFRLPVTFLRNFDFTFDTVMSVHRKASQTGIVSGKICQACAIANDAKLGQGTDSDLCVSAEKPLVVLNRATRYG